MSDQFLDMVSKQKIQVKIYNPTYKKYLFVSNDMTNGDNTVEAHNAETEPRNNFILEPVASGNFRLYNPAYKEYLFVSNDTKAGDNVVESHDATHQGEGRNEFQFQPIGDSLYKIYNPTYKKYLFVSNDVIVGDNIVEAHDATHQGEDRNRFSIILPKPTKYQLKNVVYDISNAQFMPTQPSDAAIGKSILTNNNSLVQNCSTTVSIGYEQTNNWSKETSLTTGIQTEISCGIPDVAGAKVTLSMEASYSQSWGQSNTKSMTYSQTINVNIAANSETEVDYILYLNQITVPYTANVTICYDGGQYDGGEIKGKYEGVNSPYLNVNYSKDKPINS